VFIRYQKNYPWTMEKRCSNCKEPIEPVSRTVCIKCLGTSFDYSYVDQGFETQEDADRRIRQQQFEKDAKPSAKGFIYFVLWYGGLAFLAFLVLGVVTGGFGGSSSNEPDRECFNYEKPNGDWANSCDL
jgi:hypothetical protein